ncbi:DUF4355 domain-containing protein [Staphylococcus delphini]|uniref:DUF4355 domain-containing protein n=1 Tax=Staphylococcus delphini TaxID=53344 RepID=UPI000BBCF593|nr:DUF4355 domain-containing protein [Staphylococcus delphini]PCF49006.1 phage capsid protein [Staphylococcus delphini]PCF73649.1 phage capsid protein [Staphylococcus delphini]
MKEQWLKLSLQFFNDAGTEANAETDNTVENSESAEETTDTEQLTEAQLKLVNVRVNEEMQRRTKAMRQQIQDELTEKQKEADKLRKMNAEQKHQYELEKTEKERDEYKKQLETYKMRQEATSMLTDAGMHVPDALLDLVVKETAEDTKTTVDSFVALVNQEVQRQLESKATQSHVVGNHVTTPKLETDEAWKTFLN